DQRAGAAPFGRSSPPPTRPGANPPGPPIRAADGPWPVEWADTDAARPEPAGTAPEPAGTPPEPTGIRPTGTRPTGTRPPGTRPPHERSTRPSGEASARPSREASAPPPHDPGDEQDAKPPAPTPEWAAQSQAPPDSPGSPH